MKTDLYTKTGIKSQKKVELPDDIFAVKINKVLLNKVIKVYLANQRQSNASAKTRGEVRGGGKKPWRQKGTGRARAGSLRSPIFTGGGVAFGPTTKDNHKLKLNKKEKGAAIRAAFASHQNESSIFVFEGFEIGKEKHTNNLDKIFKKAKLEGKILLIQSGSDKDLINASQNLPTVKSEVVTSINAYQILNSKNVVLTSEALESVIKIWGSEKVTKKSTKDKVEEEVEKKPTKKVTKTKESKPITKKVTPKK